MEKNKERKKGFFKKSLNSDLEECYLCGRQQCNTPKMKCSGEGHLKTLIIGDFPLQESDKEGLHFYDDAGEILEKALFQQGFYLRKDFWLEYLIPCYNKKEPTAKQVDLCFPRLEKVIKKLKPQYIILTGINALNAFFGKEFSSSKELSMQHLWRGTIIPDRRYNAFILPLFDINTIYEKEKSTRKDAHFRLTFERDIKNALDFISKDNSIEKYFPEENYKIQYLYKADEIKKILEIIFEKKPKRITFDYETNTLRPFVKDAKILTVSIFSKGIIYAFPFMHPIISEKEQRRIKSLLSRIFKCPSIRKIGHNIKFEEEWTRIIFGHKIRNWHHDTMLGAHILDNRRSYTSLNHQAYINFGRFPYDAEVDKYKKSKKGKIFNTLESVPLKTLLEYNALDVLYTDALFLRQLQHFKFPQNIEPMRLFLEGTLAFCDLQINGLKIDEEHYKRIEGQLIKRIGRLYKQINSSKEAEKFKKVTGKNILWTSNPDLGKLYYEILKVPAKRTAKGNYCTSKDILEKIDLPINKKLLEIRKYEKMLSTYVSPFINEYPVEGVIHTSVDLNIPISFRSSSSNPNSQNIPVRDEEGSYYVRNGIVARKGSYILEADFKGFEVALSCTYHKDPEMIRYLKDKSSDMHRDVACDLLLIPPEDLKKEKHYKDIRFYAKNNWTFAQFYGSWYVNCGPTFYNNVKDLFLNDGRTIQQYLNEEHEIHTLKEFVNHCEKVEKIFWKQRFKIYDRWKWNIIDFYKEHGYIENHFGFRFRGYMSRNDITNYPIQSAAFHCLLWVLIRVIKEIKKRKLKTKAIGQIHDSMLFDVPENEMEIIKQIINGKILLLQETFNWIIVPLEIEFSASPLNGSWYEKKDIA